MFLDMSSVTVQASNFTRAGRTCRAAMGFSFAAGTTDGALYKMHISALLIATVHMRTITKFMRRGA